MGGLCELIVVYIYTIGRLAAVTLLVCVVWCSVHPFTLAAVIGGIGQ